MTSTPLVLHRIVSAWLYGTVELPMSLHYTVADPIAIGLTLGSCSHRRSWHVARAVLAAGLSAEDPTDDTDEWAGDVLVSRPPGTDRVLMGLRSRPHRWLITVAAADLERFLGRTYTACPPRREQRLIDAALDAQCQLFYSAHGGNPA